MAREDLKFEFVPSSNKRTFKKTIDTLSKKKTHENLCSVTFDDINRREATEEVVRHGYVTEILKNMDLIATMSKNNKLIGYGALRILEHSATLDVFCNSSHGQYLLREIERHLKKNYDGVKRLRLHAVSIRVLYFRTHGFIISQHKIKEDDDIQEVADGLKEDMGDLKLPSVQYIQDKLERKRSNGYKWYLRYKKFLKLLIRKDILRDYFIGYDLDELEPLSRDDQNGYSMLKYIR